LKCRDGICGDCPVAALEKYIFSSVWYFLYPMENEEWEKAYIKKTVE